jgi:hypothetical protein
MRCDRRRCRAAAPDRVRGSNPRCWSPESRRRPGTRSHPSPPPRHRTAGPGLINAGLAVLADCHHRGAPADPELPDHRRHRSPGLTHPPADHRAARSVSDARAAITDEVWSSRPLRHNACGQRHTRLTHTTVTGRPPVGQVPHPTRPPAPTRPHSPTRPTSQSRACPTSPLPHYALIPPGPPSPCP